MSTQRTYLSVTPSDLVAHMATRDDLIAKVTDLIMSGTCPDDETLRDLREVKFLGATLCYPSDAMPYTVIEASASGQVVTLARVTSVNATTGHSPAYFNGDWPVWDHTYSPEEIMAMHDTDPEHHVKARWSNKKKRYTMGGSPIIVGQARYRRDWSN